MRVVCRILCHRTGSTLCVCGVGEDGARPAFTVNYTWRQGDQSRVDPTRRSARAYFFATSMSKTSDSPEYLCKKCAVKIGRGKRQEHVRLKHRKELRVLWFPDGTEGPVKRSSSDETWHCPRCHVSCGPDPEVLIVRRTAPS